MTERLATTPFGGGRMRADICALQHRTMKRQEAIAAGRSSNNPGQADKWEILRSLADARGHYGLSDRALTVLDALMSFHPERILDGRAPIIVFPSNHELSVRSRGMSGATLRRHIAALISAGLLLRRDSPNGKRYCRRDGEGRAEQAFGFDLAPLALAANDIHTVAEQVRAEAKTIRMLRSEITLHLRDLSKTLEAAQGAQMPGAWGDYALRLESLSGRLSRAADKTGLINRRDALVKLRAEVENAYFTVIEPQEVSACDAENERHIQNSNIDHPIETEQMQNGPATSTVWDHAENRKATGKGEHLALTTLLSACPTIRDYSRDGITSWKEARGTAELVRSMLGITPSAWRDALETLGETAAITVIAAMLERAEQIRSPGGYLRDLTRKAQKGQFSIHPMLKALRNEVQ